MVTVTAPGVAADMGAAIIGLLQEPARAERMAKAAQVRFAECCSIDVVAAATLDLYRRAIKS
jgi:hypothetical protein